MMDLQELTQKMLVVDEGVELFPYRDTVGKLTIGVGRNLEEVGISIDEALYLLKNDIKRSEQEAKEIFSDVWGDLDEVRRAVIIDMLFNLGKPRFLGFKKFISAVKNKDFETASKEMLDSKWAKQVKDRATRLSYMMRTGEIHKEYLK